jgi:hypothetical protein
LVQCGPEFAEGCTVFGDSGCGEVMDFEWIRSEVVEFLLRHSGLAQEGLCRSELAFSMKVLEQVPHGVGAFLVRVSL